MSLFLELDAMRMLTAALAACCCALMGNWLVLRRRALVGDAISHAVLPGIVVAFILSDSLTGWPVMVGAAVAGAVCVGLIELIQRLVGRSAGLEPGAVMGVVFSVMFALGVVLMERASARHVDLDAGCVLYGQLETIFWDPAPERLGDALSADSLAGVPRQPRLLLVTLGACALFTLMMFKNLRIAAFDPALASALGLRPTVVNLLATVLTAAAVVASFEAVGSILVIAMLICPPAAARLLTDRLRTQVVLSVALALLVAVGGDLFAAHAGAFLPGVGSSLDSAGSIAAMGGVLVLGAALLGPRHGLLGRVLRGRKLARRIAFEDGVAVVFRIRERGGVATVEQVGGMIGSARRARLGVRLARKRGLLTGAQELSLTEQGERRAKSVVRRHRQWERYLVEEMGLRADHVHDTAMRLEHLREIPTGGEGGPVAPAGEGLDPHGEPIPPA